MKYPILFTSLLLLSFITNAQDSTYYSGFDTPEQEAGWEEFRLGGEQSPFYKWRITSITSHSPSSSLIHNYPVAATDTTDDWFVSPAFNFTEGGRVDSIWTKYSGFGTPMNIDTVALYLLVGDKDPAKASEQILLHLFSDSTYKNDNTWRRIDSIDIPNNSTNSYLAFRYTTKNNWLDVQFDDISVTIFNEEDPHIGIATQENLLNYNLYPNPSSGNVHLSFGQPLERAEISVLNMQGRIVSKQHVVQTNYADIELQGPSGLYFVRISTAEEQQTFRVVKE